MTITTERGKLVGVKRLAGLAVTCAVLAGCGGSASTKDAIVVIKYSHGRGSTFDIQIQGPAPLVGALRGAFSHRKGSSLTVVPSTRGQKQCSHIVKLPRVPTNSRYPRTLTKFVGQRITVAAFGRLTNSNVYLLCKATKQSLFQLLATLRFTG